MFSNKKTILITLVLVSGIATNITHADFTIGEPVNLGTSVNSSSIEWGPCLSADGLELYFWSNRPGGQGDRDIWVATRATIEDDWKPALNLGSTINTSSRDSMPGISADGLSLFFDSGRSGGYGNTDIYVTTRYTKDDKWGQPVNIGSTVNSSYNDNAPSISTDGLELFFHSSRPGGIGDQDIWVTTRVTIDDPWGEPVNLGPTVNSSGFDAGSCIAADGLSLFFMSWRDGGYGDIDVWLTTRVTKEDPWAEPVNIGPPVNLSYRDATPFISNDGSTLFFSSQRPGEYGSSDIWQVSIEPVVDLNADGIVDSADMCIMVDHWGTDNQLCDIGPMPWGDGIVDVEDLIVLSEHLFEEVPVAQ